ncbi:sulfotransferase family 2 domain-containing protein [bacterium]|nr:sulfotransferase family 2 domain-containing protein [bacterium]
MPLDEKNRILFIHIPKTAGTTIETILDIKENQRLWGYCKLTKSYKQHYTYDDIINYTDINPEKYFTFTFVRNPYDRLISVYLQKNNKSCDKELLKTIGEYSFIDFVRYKLPLILEKNNFEGSNLHFRPQYDFVKEYKMDFIGRFENLESDFNYVAEKLKINKRFNRSVNPNGNKNRREWEFYYTEETKRYVRRLYYNDFEKFAYK